MERIQYLLRRYFDTLITPAELHELTRMLNEVPADDVRQVLEGFIGEEAPGYKEEEWDPLFEKIMAGADVPADEAARPWRVWPARAIVLRPKRWMAAAVLLFLLAGGAWFWQRSEGHGEVTAPAMAALAHDIAPGRNRATLTLANGRKVQLDSVSGVIGHQGKEELVSRNDQLLYKDVTGESGDGDGYNVLVTPRGGQWQLVLPDGTKVWLNADSYLRYPTAFKGDKREVELRGEAYFEVAAHAGSPFGVTVLREKKDPMQVEVLGTHFNIMDYGDEPDVRTTLLEGAVRVRKGAGAVVLRPGQEARLDRNDRLAVVQANVDEAVAWKNGMFKFDGADIGQVMRQLSRWYDIQVEYAGSIPTDVFQGEIYRNVNVSQILKILEASGVHFSVEGRKLLVK